tara:strand:+ start:43 stop:201 length:159 start_codon:yes stop_codon:yes gene_type:complete
MKKPEKRLEENEYFKLPISREIINGFENIKVSNVSNPINCIEKITILLIFSI